MNSINGFLTRLRQSIGKAKVAMVTFLHRVFSRAAMSNVAFVGAIILLGLGGAQFHLGVGLLAAGGALSVYAFLLGAR